MREVRLEGMHGFRSVDRHESSGFAAAALPPNTHLTVAGLVAGGRIGSHPAPLDQCLLVVSDRATVTTEDGAMEIGPGQAVLWSAGEHHATYAIENLVALIIEAEMLAEAFS